MSKSKVGKSFLENGGVASDFKNFDSHKRALEAILVHRNDEEWIGLVRKGTKEEDKARGIDIVVETLDMGKLFIQIKTRKKDKDKFCAIRRRPLIAVVVVEREDQYVDLLWRRLRQALFELRAEIMNRRNR